MKLLNQYLLEEYGGKMYKLSLNGGMTCPNRDGTIGTGGCLFCSAGGSGEFTPKPALPLEEQIAEAKRRVAAKAGACEKYIAYFQAYTNTYAPVERLRELFEPVIMRDDIAVLSIATRPDCLGGDVVELLAELNRRKPVWVELGLQTIHERSATEMRRGYALPVFDEAVARLHKAGIRVIVHLILYWPGESEEDMLESVRYVAAKRVFGVKFQLLQVLAGTALAERYEREHFPLPELAEYTAFLKKALAELPADTVVHRLTGDGPKNLLLAPKWCADKKRVMNYVKAELFPAKGKCLQ